MSRPREMGVSARHPHALPQASRAAKRRILDEFCRRTGYHRKYALRRLNGPAARARAPPAPPPGGDLQPGR